jgi:hypothetical protein
LDISSFVLCINSINLYIISNTSTKGVSAERSSKDNEEGGDKVRVARISVLISEVGSLVDKN